MRGGVRLCDPRAQTPHTLGAIVCVLRFDLLVLLRLIILRVLKAIVCVQTHESADDVQVDAMLNICIRAVCAGCCGVAP